MADQADTAPAKKRGRPRKETAPIEIPTDEWAKVNFTGPKPHFPVRGESWQETMGGPIKYFHGTGWYLEPPGAASGTGAAALETMNADARNGAAGAAPAEDAPGDLADALPDAVDDGTLADTEVTGELITEEGELTDLGAEAEIARAEMAGGDAEEERTVYDGTADRQFQPVGEETASPVVERLERFADDLEFDAGFLVEDARDFMLDLFKTRPKPWSSMPEEEQRDVAAAIEQAMVEFVRKVVETVRTDPHTQPIRALLVGYAEKDGINANLKIRAFTPEEEEAAVVGLHRARGKFVLVTVASVDDYRGGRDAETEPDQPGMEFEAGEPEFDEGDDEPGEDS